MTIEMLATVELQLIMQCLPLRDIIYFSNCSKYFLESACSSFAWAFAHPILTCEYHFDIIQCEQQGVRKQLFSKSHFPINYSRLAFQCYDGYVQKDSLDRLSKSILQTSKRVVSIELSAFEHSDDVFKTIVEASKSFGLNNLQHLQITGQIGVIKVPDLVSIVEKNPNMTNLELRSCFITDEGVTMLANAIYIHPNLKILNLDSNKIDQTGICALSATISNISHLSLGYCKPGIAGIEALSNAIRKSIKMVNLDLSWSEIDDSGIQILAEAAKMSTSLKSLKLNKNKITDKGAVYLAEMIQCSSSMTYLSVARNQLTQEGIDLLTQAMKHCKDMSGSNVTVIYKFERTFKKSNDHLFM